MLQNKWFVITGGPSTGKTTLLAELAALGYRVVPEAARRVIDEALEKGTTVEQLRSDEKKFQETVAFMKRDVEATLDPETVTFFDRGMQDTVAYYGAYDFPMDNGVEELMDTSHYQQVFLLEPLGTFSEDYARVEDEAFRKKINALLDDAYTKYGMKPVRVPAASLADRVKLIQSYISK
jgi:predicted ATPase